MRDTTIQGADLGVYRLLKIFAVLSVVFLGALAIAPARSRFTEWRAAQVKYNRAAARLGVKPVEVGLHQIWKPDTGVVDRCVSCHVGMGKGEPAASEALFKAHPALPHDPAEFGCTPCHRGQGRATTAVEAHGDAPFWDEPMLAKPYLQASCGICHTGVKLPAREEAERGKALFERNDCRRCHLLDGAGRSAAEGGKGGDLSFVGLEGVPADWHARHLERAKEAKDEEPWRSSYGEIPDEAVRAVSAYLSTRIGAPRFVEARSLVDSLGCRGCHKVNGVGGEDGPDLSDAGRKPKSDRDFSRVAGDKTVESWLGHFLADPGRVVAGSAMPGRDLTPGEVESLVLYVLSLRTVDLPERMLPSDRLRVARLGERDFPTDGKSIYLAFCGGCHGKLGEGRRIGGQGVVFPAVGNADFLGVAPDGFVKAAVMKGRAGTKMPAWGVKESGLKAEEVDSVVAYLRSIEPAAPSLKDVGGAGAPDLARGEALYSTDCAACHGARGQGGAVGSPLASPDSDRTVEALYKGIVDGRTASAEKAEGKNATAMGNYRTYSASDLASLVAWIRELPEAPAARKGWKPATGDEARGEARFARSCAGCHGAKGVGGEAPAIGAPDFLSSAGDGPLAATIVRGRRGTSMLGFGSARLGFEALDGDEVADVVRYLRSLAESRVAAGASGPASEPPVVAKEG